MNYLSMMITSILMSGISCSESFADGSYADLYLNGRGYKPCENTWPLESAMTYSSGRNVIHDNPFYKEWCINTFTDGCQIYEAYKEIAFDIEYRAEPPKTDYWQTPEETLHSKQGDCEDSVFLFFSRLSALNIDGDIVWGWVIDKSSSIAFAHVWYQLYDRCGKSYIIEGFSKEWNGIIPTEAVCRTEERVPTFILRHSHVNHVADEMLPFPDFYQGQWIRETVEELQLPWNRYLENASIIKGILQKLQDMLARCRFGECVIASRK